MNARRSCGEALDNLAHANRQLSLLNEKVAGLRLTAEQAEKAKAAFLAKVSHEFRTPLNMILGMTDLIVESPEVYGDRLPSRLLEHLEIVHRNCNHLSRIIDDVLDLSQVQAGRLTLHREYVSLTDVLHKAVTAVRPMIESKNLDFRVDSPVDLPQIYCVTIPRDLDDAARIDGCGFLDIYWRIVLPMMTPALTTVGIFTFMYHWGDYFSPSIYINTFNKATLAVAMRMWASGGASASPGREYPFSWIMARAFLLALPPLELFFFLQRRFIQGVVFTGVKG